MTEVATKQRAVKAHMDQMTDSGQHYVETWQARRGANESGRWLVPFGWLKKYERFTLPGGLTVMVKTAEAEGKTISGQVVPFKPLEAVVRVNGNGRVENPAEREEK